MRVPGINERDPQIINAAIRQLAEGGSNAIGTVVLAAGQTTTTVDAPQATANAHIALTPMTANAAAENAYIAGRSKGQFIIGHANAATTDRSFMYLISWT